MQDAKLAARPTPLRRPSPIAIGTFELFRNTSDNEKSLDIMMQNAVGDLSLKKQSSTPIYRANQINQTRTVIAPNPMMDLESNISELPSLCKNPSFFLDLKPNKMKK